MTSKKASPAESPVDKNESKNRGWPKGKRRYPKGMGAPKQPLSGYVHFLNERRDSVRAENPDITFSDLSKKMAAEWSAKSDEEKHKYNEMAKKDKDRYDKEFAEYQQTEAYRHYLESQFSSSDSATPSHKKKKSGGPAPPSGGRVPSTEDNEIDTTREQGQQHNILSTLTSSGGIMNIPIFTEEFLEHNRMMEHELRQLKKQAADFEEQNAVLSKHIDSIKSAIGKLEMETVQQRQNNASLHHHLDSIRQLVVSSFRGLQLPGASSTEPISLANVDQFVSRLLSLARDNPAQHSNLINTARDIVSRIDYAKISC